MLDWLEKYIYLQSAQNREHLQIHLHRWICRLLGLLASVPAPDPLQAYISIDYPFLTLFFIAHEVSPDTFVDWVPHAYTKGETEVAALRDRVHQHDITIATLTRDLSRATVASKETRLYADDVDRQNQHSAMQVALLEDRLTRCTRQLHHCLDTKSLIEKFFFIALKGFRASVTPEQAQQHYSDKLQQTIHLQEDQLKVCDQGPSRPPVVAEVCARPSTSREEAPLPLTDEPLPAVPSPLMDVDELPSVLSDPVESEPEELFEEAQTEVDDRATQAAEDLALMTGMVDQLRWTIEGLKETGQRQEAYLNESQSRLQEKEAHLSDLFVTVAQKESTISELTQRLQQAEKERTDARARGAHLTTQLSHLRDEVKEKDDQIHQWLEVRRVLEVDRDRVAFRATELEADLTQARERAEAQDRDLTRLSKQHQFATLTLEKTQAHQSQLTRQLDAQTREWEQCQRELVRAGETHEAWMASFSTDCDQTLQRALQQHQREKEQLEGQLAEAVRDAKTKEAETHAQVTLRDEQIKAYKVQARSMKRETKEALHAKDESASAWQELEKERTELWAPLVSFFNSLTLPSSATHVIAYITSLREAADAQDRDLATLTSDHEALKDRFALQSDTCQSQATLYEQLRQEKKGLDHQLADLTRALDQQQQEQQRATEPPVDVADLQDRVDQLTHLLRTKEVVISSLKETRQRQARQKASRQQLKWKEAQLGQETKWRKELSQCKEEKERGERDLEILTEKYQRVVKDLQTNQRELEALSASPVPPPREKTDANWTIRYYETFLQYVHTVLIRMKQVDAFQPLVIEFATFFEKFTVYTMTEEMEQLMALLATHRPDTPLFPYTPPVTEAGLKASELVSCRTQLNKVQHQLHHQQTLLSKLHDLFPNAIAETIHRLRMLFPTPGTFLQWITLFENHLVLDIHITVAHTLLTQLKSFFKATSLPRLGDDVAGMVSVLTPLGGPVLFQGVRRLLDRARESTHYLSSQVDWTREEVKEKYAHAIDILYRVFRASDHSEGASLKEMEKNYVLTVLTKPDHHLYLYDIYRCESGDEDMEGGVIPGVRVQRRKKVKKGGRATETHRGSWKDDVLMKSSSSDSETPSAVA